MYITQHPLSMGSNACLIHIRQLSVDLIRDSSLVIAKRLFDEEQWWHKMQKAGSKHLPLRDMTTQ